MRYRIYQVERGTRTRTLIARVRHAWMVEVIVAPLAEHAVVTTPNGVVWNTSKDGYGSSANSIASEVSLRDHEKGRAKARAAGIRL